MSELRIKGVFSAFVAVIGYLLNCFTEMTVVLVFLMILDYATGLGAAYVRKDIDSKTGLIGILKKFAYLCLITLAFLLDFGVANIAGYINIDLPAAGAFGIATVIVLIGNEGVSILENLDVIGIPIPKFLKKAFAKLKDKDGGDNGDN
jgi:toxin secretion/phage lysis holin